MNMPVSFGLLSMLSIFITSNPSSIASYEELFIQEKGEYLYDEIEQNLNLSSLEKLQLYYYYSLFTTYPVQHPFT